MCINRCTSLLNVRQHTRFKVNFSSGSGLADVYYIVIGHWISGLHCINGEATDEAAGKTAGKTVEEIVGETPAEAGRLPPLVHGVLFSCVLHLSMQLFSEQGSVPNAA